MVSEFATFRLPRYREIPDIGLLLDQTSRLVNSYLEPLDGVSLTTSMVSNYVKHGMIAHAVKKKYGRDQIAYLVFIAIAKTVLSLDVIADLLEKQRAYCPVELAYDRFCDEVEAALGSDPACNGLPSIYLEENRPMAEPLPEDKVDERLREILCDIAAVASMSIALRRKLERLG